MLLADRYADWLDDARINEDSPLRVARVIPELELQARWFAQEFGREFVTTAGEAVSILDFGRWNREPGPHFVGALIAFRGQQAVRGGIEVNSDCKSWQSHLGSPDYERTVLHVFATGGRALNGGTRTMTTEGREVPQIRLDVSRLEFAQTDPPEETPAGSCGAPLRSLAGNGAMELLEAAAQYRLCRKAARLQRSSSLDEGLYQALAETLGYQHNKLTFTLLAQRFPLSFLREQQHNEIEPILFGGSGFLSATDLGAVPSDTRSYLRTVWEQWWPRRSECEILTLSPKLWTLGGVRPVNHPQRRVAALAEIVRNWPVIRTLSQHCDVNAIGAFFGNLKHDYWDYHYTLTSRRSPSRMALVGETRVSAMLANVFFPAAISADPRLWQVYRQAPALDSNQRVESAAQRLLGPDPSTRKLLKQAVIQQGLLQLYEDHCMECDGNAAWCSLRDKLVKWKRE